MNNEQEQLKNLEQIPESFMQEVVTDADFFKEVSEDKDAVPEVKKEETPGELSLDGPTIQREGETQNLGGLKVGELFSAEVVTEVYDTIITGTTIAALKAFDIDTNKSDVQFSAREKKTLQPIIGACLDTLNINFKSPWEALFYVSVLIVGTKVVTTKGGQIAEKISGQGKRKEKEKKPVTKTATSKGDEPKPSKYMVKKYGREEAIKIMKEEGKK